MVVQLERVQCQICNRFCNGFSAFAHWKCTGHNLWRIIIPDLSCTEEKDANTK